MTIKCLLHRIHGSLLIGSQALLSQALAALAKIRMRTITDRGTEIGLREKLFNEVIPRGGRGAELGVYKGTLSAFIIHANQPKVLHLIDPWWKLAAEWHWAVGDKSTVRALGALVVALEAPIASGQVEIHIGSSLDVLEEFEDGYLDWAYIDSTHAYEQTKAELALLVRKVGRKGIIAGDDWQEDPEHRHHGVCRAVKEFLETHPLWQLVFQEGSQWAIANEDDELARC